MSAYGCWNDRGRLTRLGHLRGDPRVVLRDVRGVDDEQEMARRHPVDEHVVHERAVEGRECRVVACPTCRRLASLPRDALHGRQRALAAISISPMWLTSKDAGARTNGDVLRR